MWQRSQALWGEVLSLALRLQLSIFMPLTIVKKIAFYVSQTAISACTLRRTPYNITLKTIKYVAPCALVVFSIKKLLYF